MLPPELLHTTDEGTTKYIFTSLAESIVGETNKRGERFIVLLDQLHTRLNRDFMRNSERDFPRASARSGLMCKARVSAAERKGNLFRFLCLCHTTAVATDLSPILQEHGITLGRLVSFLKLYLSMESWFHSNNQKDKVKAARPVIAEVIQTMISMFPRGGQGWHLSKVHGLTKMQHYMIEFGSGINCHGPWLSKPQIVG